MLRKGDAQEVDAKKGGATDSKLCGLNIEAFGSLSGRACSEGA